MAEKYPLELLIKARKIREDNALQKVFSAKHALEELEQNIQNKKREHTEYEVWRKEEEVRKFLEIQNKTCTQKELDSFKWELAGLKTYAVQLEEEIFGLEGTIPSAEQRIVDAEAEYKNAVSQKDKIEEHKKIWKVEVEKEVARQEDVEMEEFTGKKIESFEEEQEE